MNLDTRKNRQTVITVHRIVILIEEEGQLS